MILLDIMEYVRINPVEEEDVIRRNKRCIVKKCGTLNDDSAVFCTNCGNRMIMTPDTQSVSATVNDVPQTPSAAQQNNWQNVGANVIAKKPTKNKAVFRVLAIVSICAACCVFLFMIFGAFSGKDTGTYMEADSLQRGTCVSVSGKGNLKFERVQLGDEPMGDKGTYTIFVYMCGSDLESGTSEGTGGALATADLREMVQASTNENVRFIVQTGGSTKWKNNLVQTGELGRYEIFGGEIYKLDSQAEAPMGDADTLRDFLEWGLEYAPAAKMGLVFWNHGGGSLVGVCADRVNKGILTLPEINSALAEASEKMTDKFEFIGFDACLMATIENANILVPYAEYMYASQENEPGFGWDYTAIGEYLNSNPETKGDALGKAVADSYYAHNNTGMLTFSVTDLSKIDALVASLNNYSKQLNKSSQDYQTFAMTVRGICEAENFGKNSPEDTSYTNMVDLVGIVNAGAAYANGAQEVLNAIDDAVVYSIDGGVHSDACGLSIYYPLSLGKNDIDAFDDVAVCPYYMAFVFRTAHAITNNGDMSGYDENEAIAAWAEIWGVEGPSEEAEQYVAEYADAQVTGNSNLFEFVIEPSYTDFYSDGELRFGFLLTEESYYNLASISTHAWQYLPEENVLLDLGIRDAGWYKDCYDDIVTCDATGGYHSQYLKDGQPFPQYKLQGNKYDNFNFDTSVYITPVLLNGTPTYLLSGTNIGGNQTNADGSPKITKSPSTPDFIWGVWSGILEDGTIDRSQVKLKGGDVIVPIYHAIDLDTGKQYEYYGEEYKLPIPDGGRFGSLTKKRNGEEYIVYNFLLTDVYGDTYETCYRMYKKITKTSYNDAGRPTGRYTKYEHVAMFDSLY